MSVQRAMAMVASTLQTPLLDDVINGCDMQETVVKLHKMRSDPKSSWGSLSSGERVCCSVLLDLWNGSGGTTLYDILNSLDSMKLAVVMMAIDEVRR